VIDHLIVPSLITSNEPDAAVGLRSNRIVPLQLATIPPWISVPPNVPLTAPVAALALPAAAIAISDTAATAPSILFHPRMVFSSRRSCVIAG
jgi:hypothetical protein